MRTRIKVECFSTSSDKLEPKRVEQGSKNAVA